mmetsp:Transcript_31766/g.93530  ORF Transcript_31766/g.93530 Transcript_31766/m.93530 type:complete len:145 (+) Transcript_31766:806-1240(+)
MDICEDIFNALSAEFAVLGHALVSLNEANEGKVAVVFKRMLRGIILAAAERNRLYVKINRLADWLYCVGYDDKVLRLSPEKLRWYETVDAALAYKRCRPFFFGWLERAQTRLGSYGPDGAARTRDRDEFEIDFVGHNAASVSGA